MNILMLVNWRVHYLPRVPDDLQPPDYYVEGEPYWFFRYFSSRDIRVDVVDCRNLPVLERFEREKIRFYIWQTLKVLPKLHKYDLVISHGMQSGIVLAFLRRIFGKGKYKHIVFDIGAFNSAKESGKALKIMQFAGKSLDGVIYHTKAQRDYYEKCHPWLLNKATYIPFGADTEYFRLEETDYSHMGEYILCVGSNKRDWSTLIKAYEATNQKYSLKLIGKKEIPSDNPNIEILGRIGIQDLIKEIANARFCVLPLEYLNYSFGQMTLLQQMSLGQSVIVADVPSVNEYLDNDILISYIPKDYEDLSRRIQFLMDHPEECKRLGDNARKAVYEKYNEQIMAKKIEEVIL